MRLSEGHAIGMYWPDCEKLVRRQCFEQRQKERKLEIVNLSKHTDKRKALSIWEKDDQGRTIRVFIWRVVQIVIQIRKKRSWIDDGRNKKTLVKMENSGHKKGIHSFEKIPYNKLIISDLDRIQTYNLLIRSQMLYSIELRGR